jgi:hypothetical protein
MLCFNQTVHSWRAMVVVVVVMVMLVMMFVVTKCQDDID